MLVDKQSRNFSRRDNVLIHIFKKTLNKYFLFLFHFFNSKVTKYKSEVANEKSK